MSLHVVLSILITILTIVPLIIIHVFNRKWYLLKLAFKWLNLSLSTTTKHSNLMSLLSMKTMFVVITLLMFSMLVVITLTMLSMIVISLSMLVTILTITNISLVPIIIGHVFNRELYLFKLAFKWLKFSLLVSTK